MDKITYKTTGVCSDLINVQIENNTIVDIEFIGGCNGNLKGIVSLCKGMDINQVIKKLKGIKCNSKETSCPDQLASCLIKYLLEQSKTKQSNILTK